MPDRCRPYPALHLKPEKPLNAAFQIIFHFLASFNFTQEVEPIEIKKVALLINNPEQQYEGLRSSLGLMLYNTHVQMFVIDQEIANMDEAYKDNIAVLDEMEGERFSNNPVNIEKYGFKQASKKEMANMLRDADLIIPF